MLPAFTMILVFLLSILSDATSAQSSEALRSPQQLEQPAQQEFLGQTLDPYSRAKWLSNYEEKSRDFEGWTWVSFGALSLATGIAIHSIAASKSGDSDSSGVHIAGGVFDGLGVGLGLWGTYLLLSNETITNELDALESVSRNNEKRKQTGSELLLESYATQERMHRYINSSGSLAGGLAAGIGPLFTSASTKTKVSTAIFGCATISYGIFRLLFPTKAEEYWETYKRDKNEFKRSRITSSWTVVPTLFNENRSANWGFQLNATF